MIKNRIIQLYKPICTFSRIVLQRKVYNQVVLNSVPPRLLSEQIRFDMRTIESIYRRTRNKNIINEHLLACYMQGSEFVSYSTDLIYCACSRGTNSFTSSLVLDIIQSVNDLICDNNILFSPTIDQKIDILVSVLPFKSYDIIRLVSDVFKMREEPNNFKKFIDDLIQDQKYLSAAFLISVLHLQNDYDIKEILYPLLLEESAHASVIYLNNHPDMQLKAVKFLDENLNPYATAIDSKSRKAFRTISHLINVFKIPINHCPNLQFIRSRSAVSLLIHRRKQQSVSETTWKEMIKNIIGDNEELKKFLVQKLIWKKDIKTAMEMAEEFNINDPNMFTELNNKMSDSPDDQPDEFEMTYDSQEILEEEFLKFALSIEDIKVVDNKEDFINCINEICQNYNMIGIDSEWKPHFGLSRDKLALMQLAGHDKVFIFDILLLSKCLETKDWDKLLDDIFGNPNIIKLGCGIMSDVHMILESIKGTKGKAIKFSHILDMALFYLKLQEVYPVEMKADNEKDFTKGLSSLCDLVLGKPLSKEERLCDWEKRPLQEKQLEYAALDAHCLLQVYDKLKEDAELKNINFEHLSKVAIVITTGQWKPKRKFKGVRSGKEFHVQKIIPVDQLKLVMDSTLKNFGKELRRLGVDVIIVDEANSEDKAVEISRMEERVLVCSNAMYLKVKHRVNEGLCFCLHPNGDKLSISQILERFNVRIAVKSVYSRCIQCNSTDGLKLLPEDLKILHQLCDKNDSLNHIIENNLASFSSELQEMFTCILNSNISIKFSLEKTTSYINEFSFLCKSCGNIS